MKKLFPSFMSLAAMLYALLLLSCSSNDEQKPSTGETKLCVYKEMRTCHSTNQASCPAGGELSDFCPYEGSNVASSPSVVPSSNSAVPLSSSSKPSSSSIALSSAVISSSSSKPIDGVECDGYCKWNDGCVRIATDPNGVRDPSKSLSPILSCDEAISNCKLYSPTGNIFSNSTCDIVVITPSSSSIVPSSSSIAPSSSSSSLVPSSSSSACKADNNTATQYCSNGTMKQYGSVTYGGQTYKTVVIGTQTWMAENLNYNVSGAKCYGEGAKVYVDGDYITLSNAEIQANCTTYGKLYNWMTAMASLPDSCAIKNCSSLVSAKHKGICPSGWHIPNGDEWSALNDYIENERNCVGWVGHHLRATSYGGGADTYGFTALPGGVCGKGYQGYNEPYFCEYVGKNADWWSTKELVYRAESWGLGGSAGDLLPLLGVGKYKDDSFKSVRCIQD